MTHTAWTALQQRLTPLLFSMLLAALPTAGCADRSVDKGLDPTPTPPPPTKAPTPTPTSTTADPAAAARLDMVRQALERGLDVNQTDENGRTPLMMVAFEGHTEVARLMLDHGATVDRRDATGRTALMYASSGPFPDTVDLLLEHGANPDVVDSVEGWTALMFAAGEGHVPVVEVLLRYGADPTLTDTDGDAAVNHARTRGHDEVIRLLESASEGGE